MMTSEIKELKTHISINEIKELVAEEFLAVDDLIRSYLYSEVPLIEQISHYIIYSGGKRLRPLLALLVANAFHYQGKDHITLAAIIEFIHTATLLHDDVVDSSTLRRGQDTANSIWGNAASVLAGDFLYSRAFEMLITLNSMQVIDLLAKTTNAIAEGEVLQLARRNDPKVDEDYYLKVIFNKTARLFQASAEIASLISGRSHQEITAMAQFGSYIGMAFQLIDDALDYVGTSEQLGKNIGDDLAEGKVTLPLIHAMQNSSAANVKLIKAAIIGGGTSNLSIILNAITAANSLEYTFNKAKEYTQLGLNSLTFLNEGPFKEALENFAHFSLSRQY